MSQPVPPIPPRPDLPPGQAPSSGGRPRTTWGPLEAIGIYVVANLLFGQILVGGILVVALGIDEVGGGADAPLLLVSAAAALVGVGVAWAWLRVRHPTWRDAMGLRFDRDGLRDARWGAVAGLVLYPVVALGVGTLVLVVLAALTGDPVETPDQLDPGLTAAGRALAVIYGIGVAPFAEEFFFRGVLFRSLADRRGFWVAAIVSGLVFGLVHWPTGEGLTLADQLVLPVVMSFTGVALAWIYERRQSLLAPVATHVVFNAIGLVLIFSGVGG